MSYTPNPVPQDVEQIPAFLSMELMKLADSPVKGDKGDTGSTGATGNDGTSQQVRFIYSSATSAPALPANNSTSGWNTASDSTTIWMSQQTNTLNSSLVVLSYGAWQPAVKIKGEKGDTGSTGGTGATGQRGSGEFYTSGSSWSDATANAAVTAVYPTGGNINGDTVTISNGTNFAMTKYWNGSAWIAPGTVINGNLLVDGTVYAAKINTNGLTIKDPSGNIILDAGSSSNNIDFSKIFGSTKPENNATVGANGSNLSISQSGNVFPNSDFASGIQNWVLSWNAGGGTNYTIGWDLAAPDWAPAGGHTLCVVRNGTLQAASNWFDVMYNKFFPCAGSQYLEASAYIASHRCSREFRVAFYDNTQTYISETGWGGNNNDGGGQHLSNWDRVGGFFTTPSNCRYLKIFFRSGATTSSEPYSWITKIFLGIPKSGQTVLSPWSAATSSGAFAELNQITGSNSTTYIANAAIKNALIENISADKITTGTLSASTNLTVGTAARSGSTMTGAGAVFEGTGGYFSLGNSTKNITFDGTAFYLNGPVVSTSNIANNAVTSIGRYWVYPSVNYTNAWTNLYTGTPTGSFATMASDGVFSVRFRIDIGDVATNTTQNWIRNEVKIKRNSTYVAIENFGYILIPNYSVLRGVIGSVHCESSFTVSAGDVITFEFNGIAEDTNKVMLSVISIQMTLYKK